MSWDRIVLLILFAPFILFIAALGWSMLVALICECMPDKPVRKPTKEDYVREVEGLKNAKYPDSSHLYELNENKETRKKEWENEFMRLCGIYDREPLTNAEAWFLAMNAHGLNWEKMKIKEEKK